MPLGRQMVSASARIARTSVGDSFGSTVTLTIIGGTASEPIGAAAPAANAVEATSAIATVVATSIMPAIDGCDRQRFDVRNRKERTVLNLEIDRDDLLAEADAELRDRHVAFVRLIRVERRAVRKRDRKAAIERA